MPLVAADAGGWIDVTLLRLKHVDESQPVAIDAQPAISDNEDEDEEDSDEEPEPEPEPVEPAATMAHSAWGRRILALAAAEAELVAHTRFGRLRRGAVQSVRRLTGRQSAAEELMYRRMSSSTSSLLPLRPS